MTETTDIRDAGDDRANAPTLYALAYLSTALHPFTEPELLELLEKSRLNNSRLGITGMLLYKSLHFMQVLEGEKETVLALSNVIRQDPRHCGMVTLTEGPEMERQFPDWTMGFANLDLAEARELPGYTEFLETPLTNEEFLADPSRLQRLLMVFKRRM